MPILVAKFTADEVFPDKFVVKNLFELAIATEQLEIKIIKKN